MLYCTTIFNTIHSSSGCEGGGPSLSTSMLTDMTLAASPTSQVPSTRLFQATTISFLYALPMTRVLLVEL